MCASVSAPLCLHQLVMCAEAVHMQHPAWAGHTCRPSSGRCARICRQEASLCSSSCWPRMSCAPGRLGQANCPCSSCSTMRHDAWHRNDAATWPAHMPAGWGSSSRRTGSNVSLPCLKAGRQADQRGPASNCLAFDCCAIAAADSAVVRASSCAGKTRTSLKRPRQSACARSTDGCPAKLASLTLPFSTPRKMLRLDAMAPRCSSVS